MGNLYRARIEAIREMMREHGWDAVVLSGSDPHSSEYPAERWKQVEWISGFTGEAGDIVITLDHAGLWTDTRYFIQALLSIFISHFGNVSKSQIVESLSPALIIVY